MTRCFVNNERWCDTFNRQLPTTYSHLERVSVDETVQISLTHGHVCEGFSELTDARCGRYHSLISEILNSERSHVFILSALDDGSFKFLLQFPTVMDCNPEVEAK